MISPEATIRGKKKAKIISGEESVYKPFSVFSLSVCLCSSFLCAIDLNLLFFHSADPLVGSIATQYTTNRAEHDRTAKQWTKRYAT